MDLQQLIDLELIKRLKYRYMRGVDLNDLDLLYSCLTENCVVSYSDGKYTLEGRDKIIDLISGMVDPGSASSHIAVHPEIEFDGADRAHGIWRLEDTVHFINANSYVEHLDITGGQELMGAGHYHDEYRKIDGNWLISRTGYVRMFERVVKLDGTVIVPGR